MRRQLVAQVARRGRVAALLLAQRQQFAQAHVLLRQLLGLMGLLRHQHQLLRGSISVGAAVRDDSMGCLEDLIKAADEGVTPFPKELGHVAGAKLLSGERLLVWGGGKVTAVSLGDLAPLQVFSTATEMDPSFAWPVLGVVELPGDPPRAIVYVARTPAAARALRALETATPMTAAEICELRSTERGSTSSRRTIPSSRLQPTRIARLTRSGSSPRCSGMSSAGVVRPIWSRRSNAGPSRAVARVR